MEVIRDQKQVTATLNEYFVNTTKGLLLQKHCPFKEQSHISRMPQICSESNRKEFTFRLTNQNVVKDVLDNVKANKAQGYDDIPLYEY